MPVANRSFPLGIAHCLRAERVKVSDTATADRAELARLVQERAKLPAFVPTTQEA
jgi:hypothetical protein